jgi:multicomponent Na+:H+ antiporter subunit E
MNRDKAFSMTVTFLVMFIFWLLLSKSIYLYSGQLEVDRLHTLVGIISAVIVTLLSHKMLIPGRSEGMLVKAWRLLLYIPWEVWQIVLANIDVAKRVLHPEMPIDPLVIEFDTTLRSDLALVTLANSITLTPGTITIDVEPERGRFVVHAIAQDPADALLVDKTMQEKVAHVFMEE